MCPMTKRQYRHEQKIMGRDAFQIPSNLTPTGTRCIQVNIPDDDGWEAEFFAVLTLLTKWNSYQNDAGKNGTKVATIWREAIWSSYQRCSDMTCCELRIGPYGIEQLDPGTGLWTPVGTTNGDPRTDGTVPPPWTSVPSGQSGNCLAGANIARAFRDSMTQFATLLTDGASALGVLIAIEQFLGLALPLIGEVVTIATDMAAAMVGYGAVETTIVFVTNAHIEDVYHKLQCIISCHTASDGTIGAAGIALIKSDMETYLPSVYDDIEQGIFQFFLNDFLDANGQNGLMKFAKMAGITSADCSDCDCGWCVDYDFTVSDQGWVADFASQGGVYDGSNGWTISTSSGGQSCYIRHAFVHSAVTRIEVIYRTNDSDSQINAFRTRLSGATQNNLDDPGGSNLGADTVLSQNLTPTSVDELWATWALQSGSVFHFKHVKLWGNGTPPSGAPLC